MRPMLASLLLLGACSGASAATRTAYTAVVADCVRRERIIVDRTGTTEEQDRADLAVERARCDAALHVAEGATR